MTTALAATAGFIGTRIATKLVLGERDSGWMGYLGNLAASGVVSSVLGMVLGRGSASAAFVGGLTATGVRVLKNEVAAAPGAPPWLIEGLADMDDLPALEAYDGVGEYDLSGVPQLRAADAERFAAAYGGERESSSLTPGLAHAAAGRWSSRF